MGSTDPRLITYKEIDLKEHFPAAHPSCHRDQPDSFLAFPGSDISRPVQYLMKQTNNYLGNEHAEMEDILSAAEELPGPAVRVETHRGWAIFWCPFGSVSPLTGDKQAAR